MKSEPDYSWDSHSVILNKWSTCTQWKNGNKEVSISFDDSAGAFDNLLRTNLKCFVNHKINKKGVASKYSDVTGDVFDLSLYPEVPGNAHNTLIALKWLIDKNINYVSQ